VRYDRRAVIAISDVRFRYPQADAWALAGVSLELTAGAIHGLLGPNGAGKSTLLSLLVGLRQPTSGKVDLRGAQLAWCPQDFAFYPALTARENLAFFGGVQGYSGRALAARIDAALAFGALESVADRRAATYSGGLKRRLNLAIAHLSEAEWLLLDEPAVGVDAQSRRFILDAIKRLPAAGRSVIYTSHYMEEVEYLCDRIAILDGGKVLAQGALADLLREREGVSVELTAPPGAALAQALMQAYPEAHIDGAHIALPQRRDGAARMMALLESHGAAVRRYQIGHRNLEEVFLQLTHRSLRDDA
jgi:ABC-2 type transport system ATP-binding protein